MKTIEIRHNNARNGFFAKIDGGEAKITYRVRPGGILVYEHTFVSEELRNRGIAEQITRFALDWARENGKKVQAACPYIVSFLEDRREYDDILI